jgi:hypothetical protein
MKEIGFCKTTLKSLGGGGGTYFDIFIICSHFIDLLNLNLEDKYHGKLCHT